MELWEPAGSWIVAVVVGGLPRSPLGEATPGAGWPERCLPFSAAAVSSPAMQPVVVYLVAVFLGGALLAPWLHALAQVFAAVVPELADKPFHRYVNRSLLLLAVVGMVPLLRHLGIRSFATIGLGRGERMRRVGAGFLLGVASLGAVAVVALALGARTLRADLEGGYVLDKLLQAIATAATVAVLEEALFRGAFYGALRRSLPPLPALLASSAIYAIVHFLESAPHGGAVTWWSGLAIMPRMLAGFVDPDRLVPGFFNLLLAGILLAVAYARSGSLWLSIGIHAGWIFCLRLYRSVTVDVATPACVWCGSEKLIDGWLGLPALALALAAVLALPGTTRTGGRGLI